MVISPILNKLTQKHFGSPSSSRTCPIFFVFYYKATSTSQFSSVAQSCLTLCDPMNRSTPGFPVHHQLPEFTQTHVHRVGDAIQPSHPLLSPSPPSNREEIPYVSCLSSVQSQKSLISLVFKVFSLILTLKGLIINNKNLL